MDVARLTKLDASRLARALGDERFATFLPGALATVVIPTIALEPFLSATPVEPAGASSVNFPFSPAGTMRVITLAVPAAGADLTIAVPSGKAWEVFSLTARFVSSAAAANRFTRLTARVSAAVSFLLINAQLTVTASQTVDFSWARGINSTLSVLGVLEFGRDLPAVFLGPGMLMQTVTGNIQGGDQWSAALLAVREWDV